MIEKLTLFAVGASEEERRNFGRQLIEALARCGVGHGDEFLISKGDGKEISVDANALGAFAASSDTSRQAALDNYPRSGTQRRRVLEAIGQAGEWGRTRDELAHELGLSGNAIRPRVCELSDGGFVEESGRTRKTDLGSEAAVLVLTTKGREQMREQAPFMAGV